MMAIDVAQTPVRYRAYMPVESLSRATFVGNRRPPRDPMSHPNFLLILSLAVILCMAAGSLRRSRREYRQYPYLNRAARDETPAMKQQGVEQRGNAHKGYLLIVISVAFASFITRCNSFIVVITLPAISQYFNAGTPEVSRIVSFFLLVVTSSLLFFGWLGDRIGHKRVFIAGYVAFVIGSLLCGTAQSIGALVGFRCIQALGSSMLLATSFAIISKYLPANILGWAFGILSTSASAGLAAGAPLGGLIAGYVSWQWVFLVNVPLGCVAIFVAIKGIPGIKDEKDRPPQVKTHFDFLGTLLSFAGLLPLLYALSTGKESGWFSTHVISLFAAAFVFLSLFFLWERRCREPLLDLRIFKDPSFSYALVTAFAGYLFVSGNAFILPFYLEVIKGLTSQQSGLVFMAYSIVYVVLSAPSGRLCDRIKPNTLCLIAMLSGGLSIFTYAFTLHFEGLFFTFLYLVWLGLSFVLFFAPNNTQIMRLAPEGKQGVASGLFTSINNLSMVLGIALFEVVFSASTPSSSTQVGSLLNTDIPKDLLVEGFRNAYISGGLICIIGLYATLMVRRNEKRRERA
jgi:EmrB/QacA subfamily drug resistance transporter